jgi:hypothetical protein
MQKYEYTLTQNYKDFDGRNNKDVSEAIEALNDFGSKGWEQMSTMPINREGNTVGIICHFRRPV